MTDPGNPCATRRAMPGSATRAPRDEFVADVSHDMRAPLNSVLAALELVLSTTLDAEQRELTETAQRAARGLLGLLEDVLELQRLEHPGATLEAQALDVREIVGAALSGLGLVARHKGLLVAVDIAADVPARIAGDARAFERVLVNLVANAIKFTDRGRVDVAIALRDHGRVLAITVRDTGIGVPQQLHAKMFESFVAVHDDPTRSRSGAGLGLAIVSRLVARMRGEIGVDSTLGIGSAFTVRLPLLEVAADSPTGRDARVPVAGDWLAGKPARRLRVLLADDDADNRAVAVRALEKRGHQTVVAGDGAQALAALDAQAVDIALLDVRMPVLDGLATAAAIRAREASRGSTRLPIVAVTASVGDDERRTCLGAGMDAYLAKPFSLCELLDVVESIARR